MAGTTNTHKKENDMSLISDIIRKQITAWGFAYTFWFYVSTFAAVTLCTMAILFI
jgi:hypothetical protein